ncbi:hypothetical protein [Clostridium tarantellae]|uniref:Uncharacterized protein n=1 Tax=Clostridium tarantellae TaxID=39493 RepID=A0A6I1MM08_9CLOT|nr:hypothetical protein [Clostridium tarantellae]MPQ44044.1 hypothetical protein [Clostridium tarantellae]
MKHSFKKNTIRKNKLRLRYYAIILSIFFGCILSFQFYITNKCKDLYFATKYQITTTGYSKKLNEVKNLELIFLDDDFAIVEVLGLDKEEPHNPITYNAYLNKQKNSSWLIEKTLPIIN